jgi:hypothetical protein
MVWAMADSHIFEAYVPGCTTSTVPPPFPHGVIGLCAVHDCEPSITVSRDGTQQGRWGDIMHLANAAQRLHGRQDILQKQLQKELISYTNLMHKLQTRCWEHDLHCTPYEAVVASSPERLHQHIHDMAALAENLQARQALAESASSFFLWATDLDMASKGACVQSVAGDNTRGHGSAMAMPRRWLQHSVDELAEVRV